MPAMTTWQRLCLAVDDWLPWRRAEILESRLRGALIRLHSREEQVSELRAERDKLRGALEQVIHAFDEPGLDDGEVADAMHRMAKEGLGNAQGSQRGAGGETSRCSTGQPGDISSVVRMGW